MTAETPFPVTLDSKAIVRVQQILAKENKQDAFLRVGVKGGGCSGLEYVMKVDEKTYENDLITEIGGFTVRCDAKSAKILQGSVLTYTGNLIGGGFLFENPNAARSCGCGTSFTLKRA